ncbi:MAG: ATP synthase F0 subunit B [Terriglobales bacterium]|jgi:F-type H+-transporting ATPase subunit b
MKIGKQMDRQVCAKRRSAPLQMGFVLLALFAFAWVVPSRGDAQELSATQPSQQASAAPDHKTIGGELAEETREATGADEEENASLKHSAMVQLLARKTGLSVHQAHLAALALNFLIIVVIVFGAGRKFLPAMFRSRSASIQHALEEARAASQDANHRLSDIENRLRQLDVEIGRMQATAESEANAEEARIQKAAEEDLRKVIVAAEQEIASAAKQARRELSTHTASLAIALARQQINVDSNTDQVLVRTFAAKLASRDDNGGKDGR